MSDEFPIDEPVVIPPIEIGLISLSDGTEIEIKPIPAAGAEYVDYRRKSGYTGDCTLKLTIVEGQTPAEISGLIKAQLEIELVSKTKQDYQPEVLIVFRKAEINAECQQLILAKFSLIHQIDVAHGIYPDNGMKQWIADMVIESNRCSDLIDLNQAYVPKWPEFVEVI